VRIGTKTDLTTDNFAVFESFRFVTTDMGASKTFFNGGVNDEILLILYRLLTMQCKSAFTKRFTLSTPLVCASVLVQPQFSIFCLKCFVRFGYQKCFSLHKPPNIHFFEHFLQISHNLRINHRPEQHERSKNKKVRHSCKTVSSNQK